MRANAYSLFCVSGYTYGVSGLLGLGTRLVTVREVVVRLFVR